MFVIDVQIHLEKVQKNVASELLEKHRAWFKKYFDKGSFLMLGPVDVAGAGMIVAQGKNKAEIEAIVSEDVYYPAKLATYTIRQWDVKMFDENVKKYVK